MCRCDRLETVPGGVRNGSSPKKETRICLLMTDLRGVRTKRERTLSLFPTYLWFGENRENCFYEKQSIYPLGHAKEFRIKHLYWCSDSIALIGHHSERYLHGVKTVLAIENGVRPSRRVCCVIWRNRFHTAYNQVIEIFSENMLSSRTKEQKNTLTRHE